MEKLGYNLTQTLICFENTGVYSIKLGEVLSELNAYYSEVSALEINKSKGITRGKDDKTDAKMIALYALRNIDKIVLSKVTDEAIQELKLLFAEREKIQKSITSLKMTQENEGRVNSKAYESVRQVGRIGRGENWRGIIIFLYFLLFKNYFISLQHNIPLRWKILRLATSFRGGLFFNYYFDGTKRKRKSDCVCRWI